MLHRDDDFYPIRIPSVEFQIAAMWALTDFTPENGATRIVQGSQDLREISDVTQSDIIQAQMPTQVSQFHLIWSAIFLT